MTSKSNTIDQLVAFKQRDKFSDQAWINRGLNPSSQDVSSSLTQLFNDCADALIDAVHDKASDRQMKPILKVQLVNFNRVKFDTEEKEFICDLFYEVGQILKIDFADNIMRWLYGSTLSTILKIQQTFKYGKVLETKKQNCQNCGALLETFIMKKKAGIPDYSWSIVQCENCKDYSLVSIGPDIKEVRFGKYILIEQLPKEQFTKEQAEIRLEQLRHFRK